MKNDLLKWQYEEQNNKIIFVRAAIFTCKIFYLFYKLANKGVGGVGVTGHFLYQPWNSEYL